MKLNLINVYVQKIELKMQYTLCGGENFKNLKYTQNSAYEGTFDPRKWHLSYVSYLNP